MNAETVGIIPTLNAYTVLLSTMSYLIYSINVKVLQNTAMELRKCDCWWFDFMSLFASWTVNKKHYLSFSVSGWEIIAYRPNLYADTHLYAGN